MAERLIWKRDMSQDFIKTLSDEEIINELTKHGIDLDMVNTLDREDLLKAVDSLSELADSDLEDFENKVVPMINKQTLNGMIIMSDGNKVIPTLAELMLDGIYPLSYLEGELVDDGSGLFLEADDGTQYKLYGIPEDGLEFANFVNECLPGLREDAVDDLVAQGYDESEAEEMVMNEALYGYLRDEETIESYCDPTSLDAHRPRIKNIDHLGVDETIDESCKVDESMSDLKKLDSFLRIDDVDESVTEDFTGVLSTDEFESVISGGLGRNRGNRDDSFISDDIGDVIGRQLERLGLDFDDFSDYTEMYSALDDKGKRIVSNRLRKHIDFRDIDESLKESITIKTKEEKNQAAEELSQVRNISKDSLYNMDLLTTDMSDGSFEEQFPLFTKVIISFLEEEAGFTPEEIADKDQINDWWSAGELLDDRDWATLFEGVESVYIPNKKGKVRDRILWKNVYKNHYRDFADSDRVLEEDALDDVDNGHWLPAYLLAKHYPTEKFTIMSPDGKKFILGKEITDYFEGDDDLKIVGRVIIDRRNRNKNECLTEDIDSVEKIAKKAWPHVERYMNWYCDPTTVDEYDRYIEDGRTFDEQIAYELFEDPDAWFDPEVGIVPTGWDEDEELGEILFYAEDTLDEEDNDRLINGLVEKAKDYAKKILTARGVKVDESLEDLKKIDSFLGMDESLTEGANGSVEDYLKQMKKTGNPEKVMKNAKGNPNAEKAYKQFKGIKNESLTEGHDKYEKYIKKVITDVYGRKFYNAMVNARDYDDVWEAVELIDDEDIQDDIGNVVDWCQHKGQVPYYDVLGEIVNEFELDDNFK